MRTDSMLFFYLLPIVVLVIILVVLFVNHQSFLRRKRLLMEEFGEPPEEDAYDLDSIRTYAEFAASTARQESYIDSITWDDLSMDDVFRRMNACVTSVGEETLYHTLHVLRGEQELALREQMIGMLDENPSVLKDILALLLAVGKRKYNGLSWLLFHADAHQLPVPPLYMLLGILPVLLCGMLLIPGVAAGFTALLPISLIINIAIGVYCTNRIQQDMTAMTYFSTMVYSAKKLCRYPDEAMREYLRPMREALQPFLPLRGIVPNHMRTTAGELDSFISFAKYIFLIDVIKYTQTIRVMVKYQQELLALYNAFGELDIAVSVLSFRRSLPFFCKPAYTEENALTFEGIYHPLIKTPVTNSAHLNRSCLITGSNASGKSTFIKAIALNSILAQTIYTCCARQYVFSPCYVATSIAQRDDILKGESYFVVEVKSLKRLIHYCERQYTFCFIDEILRGTNTPERLAASSAVLRHLSGCNCLCFVASHDIELTELMRGVYDNYHFRESIQNGQIVFDYTLYSGPSKTRNAIMLLEMMGVGAEIIKDATHYLETKAQEE